MNVQCDFKACVRLGRNAGVFSKLANLRSECPPVITQRPKRPAPSSDRRKAIGVSFGAYRPLIQHDRLPHPSPAYSIRRNRTVRRPDVFTDGEVIVMSAYLEVRAVVRVPELREPWIEIDVSLASDPPRQRLHIQMPADVYKQRRGFGDIQKLVESDTFNRSQIGGDEGHSIVQTKFF